MLSRLSRQSFQRKSFQFINHRHIHAKPKEYSGMNDIVHFFKKQDHFSYFLKYMMWTVFGSVSLHLTWHKIEYREYRERAEIKIDVLQKVVKCIESDQKISSALRDEIKNVIRYDLDNEEEQEKGILLQVLESNPPEKEPETDNGSRSKGKWFDQKHIYI